MSAMAAYVTTRGAVYVHSAPRAMCPHVTWALETVLGPSVRLDWSLQPCDTATVRAEASWIAEAGTGARLASALRSCDGIRYEVVAEGSPGADGSRWSYTPSLGIHHAWICASGDAVINENRVRAALNLEDPHAMRQALEDALGAAWDTELEPYRQAGEGATVRWLHRVS